MGGGGLGVRWSKKYKMLGIHDMSRVRVQGLGVNGLRRLEILLYGGEYVECRNWISQARNPKALDCSCKQEEATLEGSEVYS